MVVGGMPIFLKLCAKSADCDVRDTTRALDALGSSESCSGEIVNVGNDREIAIREFAEMVQQRTRSSSRIEHLDYQQAYREEYDNVPHRCPDLSRFRELTGFEPRWIREKTIDDLPMVNRQTLVTGY